MEKHPHVEQILTQLSQLQNEHRELEQRLLALNQYCYHTSEEQLEVRQIKKLKLAKKEQIQAITSQYP